MYGMLRNQDLGELWVLLDQANGWYWLGGLGCVLLFILLESVILHYIMASLSQGFRLTHCFLYSFVGFFFSCITPSASGGQPAQVYFMRKDGIPPAVSIPVLMVVTITYKMVLVVYALIVLLLRPPAILEALEPVLWWCYLGIALNLLFVGAYVALILCPDGVDRLLRRLLRALPLPEHQKLHWFEKLTSSMEEFRTVSRYVKGHVRMLLAVFGITFLQRSLLFFVTYIVLCSFGIATKNPGTVVVLQAMIALGTDLLPLPGGMGANETMFSQLFQNICGNAFLVPVLLVSRGISYYGQLFVSAMFTAAATFILGKREKNDRIL
jgi:uncharacterized protein (TIRG00374 family)